MTSPTRKSKGRKVSYESECSQALANPEEQIDFIYVSRLWPSSSAPFPCLNGSCKPPELCTHCYLQYSATLPAMVNKDGSTQASPQYASSTSLQNPPASILYGAPSMATPAPFQQVYTDPNHPYTQISSTFTEDLTPMEHFISEPMNSQPYNVAYAFAPLPAKSQAETSTLTTAYKQGDASSACGTKSSTPLHSRRSHTAGEKHRTI